MANVIPPELKNDMRGIVRARFILSSAVIALIAAFIALLLLLPSYVALTQDASRSNTAAVLTPAEQKADAATLAQTTALLSTLAPIVAASTTPGQAIQTALSLRPSGITVDQVMYTAGDPSTLVVFGAAQATADISAYRAALASSTLFASASVPVGQLVGAAGGRFSITLTDTF